MEPNETCKPILIRFNYYTNPPLSVLKQLSEELLARVPNFLVGKVGVGTVCFSEVVDVRGLDLDSIIRFSPGEVVVYPERHLKPPRGFGLNKPAIIRLHHCFPRPQETDGEFLAKLKGCKRTRFISYDRKTGTWTFSVKHFTRYGLSTLEEEDEDEEGSDVDVSSEERHSINRRRKEVRGGITKPRPQKDEENEENEEEEEEELEEEEEEENEEVYENTAEGLEQEEMDDDANGKEEISFPPCNSTEIPLVHPR